MYLNNWEEKALKGEFGEGLKFAYEILCAVGKLMDADRLIPIKSAHISGINYANIGDAGLEFIKDISSKAKFSVLTTINPCGIDAKNPYKFPLPQDFIRKQIEIIENFKRMGSLPSLTCTPYEGDNVPPVESHVSWAESSAVIYANSVLNLRTNRESGITALAAAIAGKTPFAGLHLNENRKPKFLVKVEIPLSSSTEYGLLGYYAGSLTNETIGFISKQIPEKGDLKALSAAIGASGASGMFVWGVNGKPSVSFGKAELKNVKDKMNTAEDGDVIFLGCPFVTLNEAIWLASQIKGRTFKKPVYLFTSRRVFKEIEKGNLISVFKRARVEIVKDVCPSLTPLVKYMGIKSVIVCSVKAAHYLKSSFNIGISLSSIGEVLKKYTEKI